jgi:branched-chain amino acid transport system substrate-binding protein
VILSGPLSLRTRPAPARHPGRTRQVEGAMTDTTMGSGRRRRSATTRREFLKRAGAAALGGLGGWPVPPAHGVEREVRIGFVSPRTGPLAGFGEADEFVISGLEKVFKQGVAIGGKRHPIKLLVKDSQSSPNLAAEVASELILSGAVDLMLVGSTPETTNPVGDQCELNEVPCISSIAPWQPWFFGRNGDPKTGFKWTYHFFWGLEDIIDVFTDLWQALPTSKKVGALWPNDGDGRAWGDPERGFAPALRKLGFEMVDPGFFKPLLDDFSAQITAFKNAKVEIVTGVLIPPDFTTFWTQARQQGFRPKAATVGKALLFPRSVEALGPTGDGLTTEVWWSPNHPFKSSLTGVSSRDLAAAYTTATKKQWTQPMGFVHALFEVGLDALARSGKAGDRAALREAIKATNRETIVGPINWSKGPIGNVAKTPLVGGQWGKGKQFPYDLVIVSNKRAPAIPAHGTLRAMA